MTTVKKSGLGLQYLVTSANNKYLSSLRASRNLIGAVTEASKFSTASHLLMIREERSDGQKIRYHANNAKNQGTILGPLIT